MLGSSAACYKKGNSGEVKIKVKTSGGGFALKTFALKDLRSLNKKSKDLRKQIFKAKSAPLKKSLKAQLKQVTTALSKISDCAMALNKSLGCAVDVAPIAPIKIVVGYEQTIPLQVSSACVGNPVAQVAQNPGQGVISVAGLSLHVVLSAGSSGESSGAVRVCYADASGLTKGCSANVTLALNSCTMNATTSALSVSEHRSTPVTLAGSSDCGGAFNFERTRAASPGNVSVAASGTASYSVGYFSGSDSFAYRICDQGGAGCSAETNVSVTVNAGEDFQGNEESLEPYREHISEEERMYLARKLANNRFDLLSGEGASMPLSALLEQRFLTDDVTAPDLKTELEEIRDGAFVYGQPIDSEEFIPDWKNDFSDTAFYAPGDPNLFKPVLPSNLEFDSIEEQHYGMERWMMVTLRSWHAGNHRYHWGWDYSIANYLTQARYLSPVRVRLSNFWMGHFGTNTQIVDGFRENLVGYYVKTIDREVFGNFRSLMLGRPEGSDANGCAPAVTWQPSHGSILCDPVSNLWLSNSKNTGENQNFARELMELYLMSPTDELSGARNYSEPNDIIAATRFVSGIRVDQYKHLGANYVFSAKFDPDIPSWVPTPSPGPRYHDTRPASMFSELGTQNPGLEISNRTMTPGQFVRHLLDNHPGVPRFIAGKLFSSIVYPDPSVSLVAELGEKLKALDYDLKAFLKTILSSEAMFSQRAAARNCVSSPLEVYSKIFNTVQLPLMYHQNAYQAEPFYYTSNGFGLFNNAGEVPLAYPSVFTYDYCGRDPGKDGSTSWLKSYLLVFRVTALTSFLGSHAWNLQFQYDLADAMSVITAKPQFQDGSAESLLGFFEQAFNLHLNSAEREILMEYLTHRQTGPGTVAEIRWNPADRSMMREKIAGMMTILSVFQQSATH